MRLDGAVVVVDEAHNLVATLPTRLNPTDMQKHVVPRQPSACSAQDRLPAGPEEISLRPMRCAS